MREIFKPLFVTISKSVELFDLDKYMVLAKKLY